MTRHSFSFGAGYDPANTEMGPLVCHDDHLLARGQGFETHRHSDLVIVSWVISGALQHTGPSGEHTLEPGQVGVLRTGAGVDHAEVAVAPQTRFVQVWLTPDSPATQAPGTTPSYDVVPVDLVQGRLVEALRPISAATFSVARLDAGQTITLPDDALQHVFVSRGALTRSSMAEPLADGDAFRITRGPEEPAPRGIEVTAAVPTELLVWDLSG